LKAYNLVDCHREKKKKKNKIAQRGVIIYGDESIYYYNQSHSAPVPGAWMRSACWCALAIICIPKGLPLKSRYSKGREATG
jgi:hypothetical protein